MRTVTAQLSDAARELITWLVPPIAPAIVIGVISTIVVGGTVGFNPTNDWIPIFFMVLTYVVATHRRARYLANLKTNNSEAA